MFATDDLRALYIQPFLISRHIWDQNISYFMCVPVCCSLENVYVYNCPSEGGM